ITDQDIQKLEAIFATKSELKEYAKQDSLNLLSEKVDDLQEHVGDLRIEFAELRENVDSRFNALDLRFDTLESKFDGMLGLLTASMEEHSAGAVHLARHDRHIGALAAATGVTLPD
ncbi:MAG: hypothetical protein Q8K46_04320, partial [Deltaproteobacteria bacterium]|nr:hypothetical protein [Deltaproteobacteria bacterium]